MSGEDEGKGGVEFIDPPDTLTNKVSVTSGGVDPDVLEKAEQIIANMQSSYLDWVEDDLARIQALYSRLLNEPEAKAEILKDIFTIAHDVKGQGGSFDFPLMTRIGNSLCRFIERIGDGQADKQSVVIKVHIDAMRVVISNKMSGDGGKIGDNLLRGLDLAVEKTAPSKAPGA